MAYAQAHPQHGSPADLDAGDREPFEVLLHLNARELEQPPLEEERHRAAAAAWADAADRHDRERTEAYARELRQDDAP